jgi:hypothetical protein
MGLCRCEREHPVHPSLETKHLHERGEDAEGRGKRKDPPVTTQL